MVEKVVAAATAKATTPQKRLRLLTSCDSSEAGPSVPPQKGPKLLAKFDHVQLKSKAAPSKKPRWFDEISDDDI